MNYTHVNFAEPLWLWCLLIIPLGWAWSLLWRKINKTSFSALNKFIDQNLLPHILISNSNKISRTHVGLLYTLLVFCMIIALANPRWSYRDLDAFQSTASMVILLDLSTTMNTTDVSPSRIGRARQNIEDLLNLSKGLKIGLIGFAGHPHLISPITDDIQTIKTYIPALDTDLTNVQGNSLHTSLRMAAELLASEPGDNKSILLVSDGNLASNDYSRELNALSSQNIQVHVIGVGTEVGAPYKNKNGALHKVQGKIVVSKLNAVLLKNIAQLGHGIYTEAGHNDLGIRAILSKAEDTDQEHVLAGKIRQWDDHYYLFIIPAAAILIYLMRQRILYVVIIGLLANVMLSTDVYALEVKNAFLNSEQIGQQSYKEGDFKQAAEAFRDPYHKGVALYRTGQFAEAEQQFNEAKRSEITTSAIYNAGNAQMQQRKWRAAIKSYEIVLSMEPENFAAQHNLEIARKMLAENDDQDEQSDDCECNNKEKSDKSSKEDKEDKEEKQDKTEKEDKADCECDKNDPKDEKNPDQQNADQNESNNSDMQPAQSNNAEHKQEDKRDASNKNAQQLNMAQLSEDEARVEQWLNRIDSDIKVFLKNKFYVEDVLSAQ